MDNENRRIKVCAGIVTYNPDLVLLNQNIESIVSQVEKIYIVDNCSKNRSQIASSLGAFDITIIENNENKGIARALNQLCCIAIQNGFNCILTLDQDSVSPSELVSSLVKSMNNEVAIVGPNIVYKNNESFARKDLSGVMCVEWTITSASLTNLVVWKRLSGFDEYLFIDGVDRDFCIRANRCGYKVLVDYDVSLLHELGNLKCRKLFGKTVYVTNHSEFRKYYMVRNSIYIARKLNLNMPTLYVLKILFKTILYEDKKRLKTKAIFKGIKDGFSKHDITE